MSTALQATSELSFSNSIASSSAKESRLVDKLGISVVYCPSELRAEVEIAGVVALAPDAESQQKNSRFHNRQLRLSNLRPSSNDAEHFEKTIKY